MKKLFTERFGLTQPRVNEALDADTAIGLLGIIQARISENWFGEAFPAECEDGGLNAGCDTSKLKGALAAYNLIWPADWPNEDGLFPDDPQIFDLIEFSYEHVAIPEACGFHSYWRHDHYKYDQEKGRAKFTEDVNRVFERHGMAFELVQGEVTRIAPTGLQEALAETVFKTGDNDLDRLLETARGKFLNRSLDIRKEALEKLWDAWERLKTIEPGKDKRTQAKALLDKATTEPNLRARLEKEAMELTEIGNNFMIRHTETTKTPITESVHVDYLFHRMFSLIQLLLKSSGRGA
ncbi:MAG: hypothetical protein Q8Q12_21250 [bacterium]|nr:hypothetical protein [bacterium]